ncbi:MAG: hypothetical protein A3J38_07970 [Gammaproteobacteria bacterium RIFCSPHIGHO2_12_FULL_45_9]|nr:MAG: hypothetical protein A3J38_07970 [Gammaproteobacteria bacterium RIFCSPHIGHO2_12_FULL_45_9]
MLITGLSCGLTACNNYSPDTYQPGEAQQASSVAHGVITSIRPVKIAGSSGVGTVAGAVAGGAAGSMIGGSTAVNVIGAVGGAVVGGLVGGAVEKGVTSADGVQIVVKLKSGRTVSIVQAPTNLRVGDHVMVMFGEKARVVLDQ